MFINIKIEINSILEPDFDKYVKKLAKKYNLINRSEYDEFTSDLLESLILEACIQGEALSAEMTVSDS